MAKLHFKPTSRFLTGRGMYMLIALCEHASRFQTMLMQACTDALQAENADIWRRVPPHHERCCYTVGWVLSLMKLCPPTSYIHSLVKSRLVLTLWILNVLWCNYCLTLQPFQAPYIRKKRELNMRSLKIKLLKGDRSCFVSSRNDVVPLGEAMLSQRRCSAFRQYLLLYFSEVLCFSEVLRCSAFRNEPVLSLCSCKTCDFHTISQANLLVQTAAKISLP